MPTGTARAAPLPHATPQPFYLMLEAIPHAFP
jgi:hypothetical protein